MSETTKTTAKAATKAAAKKAVEKEIPEITSMGVSLVGSTGPLKSFTLGAVGATVGIFAVLQGKAYLAKRRLQKEIDEATSGEGHESRESRA
jgi:hypothetical protein